MTLTQLERPSPVVVVAVAAVVPVAVVLLVGPLAGQVVWSVVARAAVGVPPRAPLPVVVLLVPVLLVLVVPLPAPHLVAVAAVVELSIPLPVSSVCHEQREPLSLLHAFD